MTTKTVGTAATPGLTIETAEIADGAVTSAKLADTAVTPGSYLNANITVDQEGRLTAAESWVIESAAFNGDLTGPSALDTTTGVGAAFTNQPANDGIEILSDDPLDITQSVTIIGTTNGADTVVVETIALDALDGTTPVASVKVDWGVILAVKLSAACAGTVTVREASADATIVTLAAAVLSAGVETVAAPDQSAWNRTVSLVADGATTKQIGLKGTDNAAAVIYDSQALAGTTAVLSNSAFVTVTEIYTGDLENTVTVTQTATAGTKLDGSNLVTESGAATLTGKVLGADTTVKFGSGTATGKPPGVYAKMVSAAGVGNTAATTDDPLWTLTALPANTFTENGDALILTLSFITANNANNKRWGVTVGGTQINVASATASNIARIGLVTITRVDSTHVNVLLGAPNMDGVPSGANLAVSDLTTNTLAIVVTGASPTTGAANDIKLHSGVAEIKR